jgi:putative DNA primase/helicase
MYLIRAHTPGTGKSYLVDVIATVATGRPCPVITAGKGEEETEKRLGTILLGGSPIVSLVLLERIRAEHAAGSSKKARPARGQ